jgi:isoamylase
VLQLVMDSLRYWVQDMHVDGFRFDLAATLARGAHTLDTWSGFFATIHQDPVLQGVKLIAEPWDTGTNGYQVGNFPFHWSEWNDRYRETVRRFWREEPAVLPDLATRLTGSADLFQGGGRTPSASINYITSHDGLTLADLAESSAVLAGIEAGAERDQARTRLQRNLLATLLLSMGTPMITAGDEWGRSQQGHDNPYDQDNAISWLHWSAADQSLRSFVRHLIRIRREIPWLQDGRWPQHDLQVSWLRPDGQPLSAEDWLAPRSHLGLLGALDGHEALLLLNAGEAAVDYALPEGAGWQAVVRTDCADGGFEPTPVEEHAEVPARSVILLARRRGEEGT